jgi:hypothetical protein
MLRGFQSKCYQYIASSSGPLSGHAIMLQAVLVQCVRCLIALGCEKEQQRQ